MSPETIYQTDVSAIASNNHLETPILFMIFSRPDTTLKVFEEIRNARPKKLFIAADGPRENRPGEAQRCVEARQVVNMVDWPCEVHTLLRDKNLGCGRAVSGAITWFFEHVTEGIILEDDTLPSPDFFRFCVELLERYRDDTRVWGIAGHCLPNSVKGRTQYSYFFSNWDYIWGWATWKRAWKHYDYEIKRYKMIVDKGYFHSKYTSLYEAYYMKAAFDKAYYRNNEVTWWDHQWGFARKINSGLFIVPVNNMVINLGLGNAATNTKDANRLNFLKLEDMKFPLAHPEFVMHDRITDDEVFRAHMTTRLTRLRSHARQIVEWLGLRKK